MWAMVIKEFRELRRDRRTMAMLIVLPLLLLVVFGYAANFKVSSIPTDVYGPQAQQVFDLFRQNPNAQAQLRAPIFEDKVVDLIVSKAKVEDDKVSKEELLKEDDLPEGYGE